MDPEEVACVLAVKLGPRAFTWITDMLAGLPKLPNKIEHTTESGLFQAVGLLLSGKEIKDAFAALRKVKDNFKDPEAAKQCILKKVTFCEERKKEKYDINTALEIKQHATSWGSLETGHLFCEFILRLL